jgi:hypothetical protein
MSEEIGPSTSLLSTSLLSTNCSSTLQISFKCSFSEPQSGEREKRKAGGTNWFSLF